MSELHPARPFLIVLAALCSSAAAQSPFDPSLLGIVPPTKAQQAELAQGLGGAAAEASKAVVHVIVEVQQANGPAFPIERPSSGVLVSPHGHVVTMASLVQEVEGITDKRLFVQLSSGAKQRLSCRLVRFDDSRRLALLQLVGEVPAGLPHLALSPDAQQAPGSAHAVLAFPDGKEPLCFTGVAAHAPCDAQLGGKPAAMADVLLTDAKADLRNEGAVLVDSQGRLVGLCATEFVRRDVDEPTLEQLQQPSFMVAFSAGAIARAFGTEISGSKGTVPKRDAAPDMVAAVARAAPAVVSVWVDAGERPAPSPKDLMATRRIPGLGSGVVLSRRGLVVTNRHIVARSAGIRVQLASGTTVPARLLKANTAANLALLQLELPTGTELQAIDALPDGSLVLGEPVAGIGRPYGTALTVSAGVLSARRENGRLQADPNLGNQNGGGALVDANGRLLAIVDGGAVDEVEASFRRMGDRAKTETNLSFCIDVATVRRVFAAELEAGADPTETIRSPREDSGAQATVRGRGAAAVVERAGAAMLNLYVMATTAKADLEDNPFADVKEAEVRGESLGSGVVISASGLAVSNWHVVDSATNPDGSMNGSRIVQARGFDGTTHGVRVLSISREDDLALLQLVPPEGTQLTAVPFGDSTETTVGSLAVAIGNPLGQANTITAGVLSARNQGIRVKGRWAEMENLLETDAAINGGNSGGALLDGAGRLLGINSAGSSSFSARGYAIPVHHVRQKLNDLLLSPHKLRSPNLGIRTAMEDGRLVVAWVDPRGPAARAGVAQGDRIRSLAGTAQADTISFALALMDLQADRQVELGLQRDGQDVAVKLAPSSHVAWSLVRQCGLECEQVDFGSDAARVRAAATAMQRKFTGIDTSEPSVMPDSVVRVVRVHAGDGLKTSSLEPDDLLLAVELVQTDTRADASTLRRFLTLEEVRDTFQDRMLGSYEGKDFRCWVYRGSEIVVVDVKAKRLLP